MKTKTYKYILIADDWNKGFSIKQLAKKYEISEHAVYSLLDLAEKHGIKLRNKKNKYELIAEDWNRGLKRKEIAEIYSIKYKAVNDFLRAAKDHGIRVYSAAERKKMFNNQNESDLEFLDQIPDITGKDRLPFNQSVSKIKPSILEIKDRKQQIIELLKEYKPIEVAKLLKISTKEVYDVIDLLSSEELNQIRKAFVRNRKYIFLKVKSYRNKGMNTLEALKKIEQDIPFEYISQLTDVYFIMELYPLIERLLNRILNLGDLDKDKKEYLNKLKNSFSLEVKYAQVRKECKQLLSRGRKVSFNRLSEKYELRFTSLIDVLGREDNYQDETRNL